MIDESRGLIVRIYPRQGHSLTLKPYRSGLNILGRFRLCALVLRFPHWSTVRPRQDRDCLGGPVHFISYPSILKVPHAPGGNGIAGMGTNFLQRQYITALSLVRVLAQKTCRYEAGGDSFMLKVRTDSKFVKQKSALRSNLVISLGGC